MRRNCTITRQGGKQHKFNHDESEHQQMQRTEFQTLWSHVHRNRKEQNQRIEANTLRKHATRSQAKQIHA